MLEKLMREAMAKRCDTPAAYDIFHLANPRVLKTLLIGHRGPYGDSACLENRLQYGVFDRDE